MWLDATYVSCREGDRVEGRAVVTAIASGEDRSRRYVGLDYVDVGSFDSWRGFLRGLRSHGVFAIRLVVSDARAGLRCAVEEVSVIDPRAGVLLDDVREDALAHHSFSAEHRLKIRCNNVRGCANREIKRRTSGVQGFPSFRLLVRLVGTALADQNDAWAEGRFMDADGA